MWLRSLPKASVAGGQGEAQVGASEVGSVARPVTCRTMETIEGIWILFREPWGDF